MTWYDALGNGGNSPVARIPTTTRNGQRRGILGPRISTGSVVSVVGKCCGCDAAIEMVVDGGGGGSVEMMSELRVF